jgi:exodeoxyribonuclease VII small subunit
LRSWRSRAVAAAGDGGAEDQRPVTPARQVDRAAIDGHPRRLVAVDPDDHRLQLPLHGDFESAIAELETLVKQLEDGDLPLDTSLQLFERGVELSRYCHDQLGAAQKRIELLTERGDLKDGSALVSSDDSAG